MTLESTRFPDLLLKNAAFSEATARLWTGSSISVDGAVGGACALAVAGIKSRGSEPLLVMVPRIDQVDRLADDIELFSKSEVIVFPAMDDWPGINIDDGEVAEAPKFWVDDLFGQRLRALKALAEKGSRPMIVAPLAALFQPVPTPKLLATRSRVLRVGGRVELDEFRLFLTEGGYHATPAVDLPGEFAVRGYILDLFAPDWQQPVRIEFFGDEIESIRRFDIATQRSLETLPEVRLTRLLPTESTGAALWDYLPKTSPVILVEPRDLEPSGRSYLESLGHPAGTPTTSDVLRQILKHPTASFSELSEGTEDIHLRLPTATVERFQGTLETICREIDVSDSEHITIFCPTQAEIDRLRELFAELKPVKEGRLDFIEGRLSSGFGLRGRRGDAKHLLLSAGQLFNRHDIRRPKRRQLGQVIDSFLDLKPGDFVVHVAHGVARYRGIETITKSQQAEEHLRLEFADNQALFVPVSKIGLVQKYVAGGRVKPKLAKIGGQLWARHKKAVQEAVFDLAEEMIDIQATREARPGVAFPPDSDWQKEFDAAFPFRETNDQLLAIEAVKQDMERPRPMDRLLCGDVGFGKTEVAVRAAFKAVDSGFQVAVLVPTTILAEQHARTFGERMREFPITVAALSRFQSKAEQSRIVEDLAMGRIDIVIGTHRVVSSDISFHNLGLVVIDEEQRFGVKHKERLKTFRESVDVLTMTATPIPRTLHFSLLGIREISNLETPPEDRLAVETKLIRFDEDIIRRAVLRELNRGGQIYFVHNRVYDIDELARRIQHIVPECRIGVGHAQMSDGELESVMSAFVRHEFDMLLSTTIIESGLDIPNANTMFIDEANRYGLADLHQLRGRVGRFKHQAYCYLLLAKNQMLTSQAAKRLRAIEEYAHLGSGFHLAMRDLEIRGAGNILGTQQSGHIATVGYEMYCQFLETAVRALKRLPPKTVIDVELDLPGLAQIPLDFVADHRVKIDLYRRLTRVATLDEGSDLTEEIRDRFGNPPPEVRRLLTHAKIRVLAHGFRIRSVTLQPGIGGDSGYVVFRYVSQPLMDRLAGRLESRKQSIRFTGDRQAFVPMPGDLSPNSPPDDVLDFVVSVLE